MASETELTLWSIQKADAWEHARARGALRGDGRRVPDDMRPAYRWLMGQMSQRVASYQGGYPVWAYPNHKPDLRRSQFGCGISGVRIEFVANRDDILVSDLGAWEAVLYGDYCSLNEQDEIDFHYDDEFFSVWRDSARDPERAQAIIKSWERIFDLAALAVNQEWWGPSHLQATIGQVSLEQVVAVTPFVSK